MRKHFAIASFLLLILASSLLAESAAQTVSFQVYKNSEPLRGAFLLIEFHGANDSFSAVKKTDSEGKFTILLSENSADLKASAMTFDSSSNVNGISPEIQVSGAQNELYIFSAGTVRGQITGVSSSSNISLVADCSSPLRSSSFSSSGTSFTEFLPSGKCRISARSDNKAGSVDVEIAEGKMSDTSLVLSEENALSQYLLPLAAVLALLLAVLYFFTRKKDATIQIAQNETGAISLQKEAAAEEAVGEESPEEAESTEEKPKKLIQTKKMKDIVATLDERQKSVVEFLLSYGGKARQSKIRYACKIPKTSFFRVVRSLEKKNIINSEKYLNTKEIVITDWFLSE